jgi:hypothetical protein
MFNLRYPQRATSFLKCKEMCLNLKRWWKEGRNIKWSYYAGLQKQHCDLYLLTSVRELVSYSPSSKIPATSFDSTISLTDIVLYMIQSTLRCFARGPTWPDHYFLIITWVHCCSILKSGYCNTNWTTTQQDSTGYTNNSRRDATLGQMSRSLWFQILTLGEPYAHIAMSDY